MPIVPPRLDDRSFEDLVEELISRIPGHTPEWTHPREGDPGRTLLELFAWLADTILYRANLVPERQRLVFLRLLGIRMRPAAPATGIVGVQFATGEKTLRSTVVLGPRSRVIGPLSFETRTELTVPHLHGEAYCKRPLTEDERKSMAALLPGLTTVYGIGSNEKATFYTTNAVFSGGAADAQGFDVVRQTVDGCLWIALLAPKLGSEQGSMPTIVETLRRDLQGSTGSGPRSLSIGVAPAIEVPSLFEEIGSRARIPITWEMSGPLADNGEPTYHRLAVLSDTTLGLTRRGVVQVVMPGAGIDAPSDDVRMDLHAGLGNRPPRLDDPERAARLVAWIRLRPTVRLNALPLSWIGLHVVEIDQRATTDAVVIGESNGLADQEMRLPGQSVEEASLQIEIEEVGFGYRPWTIIDDIVFARRTDSVFQLDAEAGTIRFGDGMRGRIPGAGMRVRVARMRSGGGAAGNVSPGVLTTIQPGPRSAPLACQLEVSQPMAMVGGQNAETLFEAERRIPSTLRHGERAVTAEDFQRLAAQTPGVLLGRVEVLPRFKPHQRRENVPGVVSVMILPFSGSFRAPNPRPDRPMIEAVHAFLDARRTISTEHYVIACEYVPIGVSVGISVREGYGREAVVNAVRDALARFLWPIPPGGPTGAGWPLGRSVRDREIEVVVAQVPGVESIFGVRLFSAGTLARLPPHGGDSIATARFERSPPPANPGNQSKTLANAALWLSLDGGGAPVEVVLRPWQLPELLSVVVDPGGIIPTNLHSSPDSFAGECGIAVPVVPEVC